LNGGDPVFQRLRVDHMVQGITRLSWEVSGCAAGPGPWMFKPQISDTGVSTSIWTDLTDWLTDVFTVEVGPVLRGGRNPTTHFRVLFAGGDGIVRTSHPQHVFGTLSPDQWSKAQFIVQQERLRFQAIGAPCGWLLKRKRLGDIPDPTDRRTAVTDYLTGEITKTVDPTTVGTEYFGGFYAPVWYQLDAEPGALYEQRDEVQERGTIDDDALVRQARIIFDPPVAYWDAFVVDQSDLRFYFHRIKHVAEIGMVPLISQAELRLAPFTDVIYTVEVPQTCARQPGYCYPHPAPYAARRRRAPVAAADPQGHDGL
jgi:hypothetical protein